MVKPLLSWDIRRMPFAKLLLFLCLGILWGRFLTVPIWVVMVLPYILYGMVSLLIALGSFRKRTYRPVFPPLCYTFLSLLGAWLVLVEQPEHQRNYFGLHTGGELVGIIDDEPVYKEKTVRFPVKAMAVTDSLGEQRVSGRLMLTVRRDSAKERLFRYGDKVIFKNLSRPVPPAYNPVQFNYKKYLAHQNIYKQAFLSPKEISVLASGEGNILISSALQLREVLVYKFNVFVRDAYAFQINSALIFGYRTEMDAEVLQAFTNTGTIHVLSVSGLHVSIVFGLLYMLLRFMDRWPMGRTLRFGMTLIAIWSYVILTGMAPAILRAGIMITFFVVASWTNRSQNNLNTLFASAFFILLFSPQMLMDVGFQLSYTAMLGLFTLYPLGQKVISAKHKYVRLVLQYILVSISAQLFTAPLALYYFHQFPTYFLLGNLLIAIPATLMMYGGMALALSPWGTVNVWLGKALKTLISWTFTGLKAIDGLPYAVWQGIDFGEIELVSLSLSILCLIVLWNYRSKRALFMGLMSVLMLWATVAWRSIDKQSFSGLKFYNTQQHLTVGIFDSGNIVLLSTLDSLKHPQLVYQVWPDIQRYGDLKGMKFTSLASNPKQNSIMEVSGYKVGILDTLHRAGKIFHDMDIVVWRHGNFTDMEKLKDCFILFDGSNSDKRLCALTVQADTLGIAYYVLKDNFAYVWERK